MSKRLQMKTALAAGDWTKAIAIGRNPSLLSKFSILRDFIVAAREEGNADALDLAETAAKSGTWNKPQRYALAREFVDASRLPAAWYALNGDGDHDADPGFAKQARRICTRMPHGPLRQEIMSAIKLAAKGGSRTHFLRSEAHFPTGQKPPQPFSKVLIAGSPAVPTRHLSGIEAHVAQYLARLANPLPPSVDEISNVFVDGEGQIWGENGEVYKDTGRVKPLVKPEEVPIIDCGFHFIKPTRGIYHWLIDRVPHLSVIDSPGVEEARLLFSSRGPAFEDATLDLAGIGETRGLRVSTPVFVRRLLRPRVGFAGMRHWDRVCPVIDAIKMSAQKIAQHHGVEPVDRLYISRRDSRRRVMVNEGDVENLMAGRGYNIVAFGEIPLWQQIFLASNATHIVSPHGAGLAHIIFMRDDVNVTEVLPIRDGTYVLRLNYAVLSAVRGLNYKAWIEPQLAIGDEWSTDLKSFDQFLSNE